MSFRITRALREYYRYTGPSAEVEKIGYGCSRPGLAWAVREKQRQQQASSPKQNQDSDLDSSKSQ
jgi:hypothetical protein